MWHDDGKDGGKIRASANNNFITETFFYRSFLIVIHVSF